MRPKAEMRPTQLGKAEERLRHAVAHQEYAEAGSHIVAYCDAARDHLDTLRDQDSRHRAALKHVLDVLEWARLMLCAGRAADSRRLERAALADRYLGRRPAAAPSTLIDF